MLYSSEKNEITMVLSGDAMITRPLSVFDEPQFLALSYVFKKADVAFTNLEMLMHDYGISPGIPGGVFAASDPKNLNELEWFGVNMVALANNHSWDYSEGGILNHLANLKKTNLIYSGIGKNLSEARAPGYLDTKAGRVALISLTTTFPEAGRAVHQRPDAIGRPGVNPLGYEQIHKLPLNKIKELKTISEKMGYKENKKGLKKNQIDFLTKTFETSKEYGIDIRTNKSDEAEIITWIKEAKAMSDYVLVSIHCHEDPSGGYSSNGQREQTPEFLRNFSKKILDNGADVVAGHGPHVLRGMEIYKNKPIFYSLGNFIFQNDTIKWHPHPTYENFGLDHYATPSDFYNARYDGDTKGFPAMQYYWESIVAECVLTPKGAKKINLFPIELGYKLPRSQRGRPVVAREENKQRIINKLAELSSSFGTEIQYSERGVGEVILK